MRLIFLRWMRGSETRTRFHVLWFVVGHVAGALGVAVVRWCESQHDTQLVVVVVERGEGAKAALSARARRTIPTRSSVFEGFVASRCPPCPGGALPGKLGPIGARGENEDRMSVY